MSVVPGNSNICNSGKIKKKTVLNINKTPTCAFTNNKKTKKKMPQKIFVPIGCRM
jgi:hypothetical protein